MMSKLMRCSVTIWLFCLSILFVLLVHDQNTYVAKRVGYTVGFKPRNTMEKDKHPGIIGGMDAAHALGLGKEEAESEEEEDEPPPLLPTTTKIENQEEKRVEGKKDKEEPPVKEQKQENEPEKETESGEEEESAPTTISQKEQKGQENEDEKDQEREGEEITTVSTTGASPNGQKDEKKEEEEKNEADSYEEENKLTNQPVKAVSKKKEDVSTKTTVKVALDEKKDGKTEEKATSRASRLPYSSTSSPKKPTDSSKNDEEIEEKYKKLPELRFHNSSKSFSKKYYPLLEELGLTGNVDYIDLKKPLPNVTLVSAVSENHAGEGRSMVARLAKDHPNWQLVLYDMGLKNETRSWFEKACNVELRDINLTHYGVASNLKTYRWKAVIIADALLDFPAIFWVDSSTFLATNMSRTKFIEEIEVAQQKNGPHAYLLDEFTHHSTFAVTTQGMYDYLSPQGDHFQQQWSANKMLFFRTKETIELALKWYVLCSLEVDCMAPKGHKLNCNFKKGDSFKTFANCHRYDQSAINLVLLSYKNSLLGNWTLNYTWTKRGKERDASPLLCEKTDEE